MTGVSHGRCVQRVCCRSWSCTPHIASCPSIDNWTRSVHVVDAHGFIRPPIVIDDTVRPGRIELRNERGYVIGGLDLA